MNCSLAERTEQTFSHSTNTAKNFRSCRVGFAPQLPKLFNCLVDILRLFWLVVAPALQSSKLSNAGIDVLDLLHRLPPSRRKSCAVSCGETPEKDDSETERPIYQCVLHIQSPIQRADDRSRPLGATKITLHHQCSSLRRTRPFLALGRTLTSKVDELSKTLRNHRNGGPLLTLRTRR